MTTEYRQGIPSHAHIEAATRLGLLWHSDDGWFHHFRLRANAIEVTHEDWVQPDVDIRRLTYRPIRPDGTPVDWETLDAEVARVAGVTSAAQPQGFREDDRYPGRYVLFRSRRGQWVFVRYLRILVAV